MIALIGNLDLAELLVIALVAVMVFGKDLPRVAAQAVTNVTKARRSLQKVWRESGIGDEIRNVQREIDVSARSLRDADPRTAIRTATRDIEAKVRRPVVSNEAEATDDPDAARVDEPEAERERRPPWYPGSVAGTPSTDGETPEGIPSGPGISPGGIVPPAPRDGVEEGEPAEEAAEEEGPKGSPGSDPS